MDTKYELYTYFRSSCSARVRIAAYHKGVDLTYHFVNLLKNEQTTEDYAQLNTSKLVPTFVATTSNGRKITVQQSVAILEFLEESRPDLPPLLPKDLEARTRVRELVNVVACDIQPVTNLRILKKIREAGLEAEAWQQAFFNAGLQAYENLLLQNPTSSFSVGDVVTMADVVLAPTVDGALRFGVKLDQFPNVKRIYDTLMSLPAFQKGGWKAQPDTPAELRG